MLTWIKWFLGIPNRPLPGETVQDYINRLNAAATRCVALGGIFTSLAVILLALTMLGVFH